MRVARSSAARLCLTCLLFVYGCLFVVVHRMELDSAPPQVKQVPNPFERPAQPDIPAIVEPSNTTAASLYPVPLDWENRLVEGRLADFQSGKDLWEYTNLPSWMTGL